MYRSDTQNLENLETPTFDDKVLKDLYVEYETPCDHLVGDPKTLMRFVDDYAGRTDQQIKPAQLARHLLNLRKRGQAKGGLPRLRRKHNRSE